MATLSEGALEMNESWGPGREGTNDANRVKEGLRPKEPAPFSGTYQKQCRGDVHGGKEVQEVDITTVPGFIFSHCLSFFRLLSVELETSFVAPCLKG